MTAIQTPTVNAPAPGRAEAILAQAKAPLLARLWQAALGAASDVEDSLFPSTPKPASLAIPALPQAERPAARAAPALLRGNGDYAPALARAAARTGLPAAALTAVIDAEAGKRRDGSWDPAARNPRSTATGLGQFLDRTWIGEAERRGTYLNGLAAARGWLDARGRVRGDVRPELLDLRTDPGTAIEAVADYARAGLSRLESAGVKLGNDARQVASLAWLGHHLGPVEALRFVEGRIAPARAKLLLTAQVGASEAARRIADAAGDAVAAHRQWLTGYIGRVIQRSVGRS